MPLRFVPALVLGSLLGCAAVAHGAPSLRIVLPERTRLLVGQQVDIVLEVRDAASVSGLRVTAGNADLTARLPAPERVALDCDTSTDG